MENLLRVGVITSARGVRGEVKVFASTEDNSRFKTLKHVLLGTLTDVLQTGANDVYCVKMENGKELLLPAIKDCILNVDLEKQEMLVHVLDGLLDL